MVMEAARLNSPSRVIKITRDFNSVARQCSHLSLWPPSPWGRRGRPAPWPSLNPPQKASGQSTPATWSADSEEGQPARGNKYIRWESWSVEWDPCGLSGHHLLCGLSSCIPASRLSVICHMFTQIQRPPPHRLLLLEHPFSPRLAP